MKIIKPIALASSLAFPCAVGSWSPASAANVDGYGDIATNLAPPLESVSTQYEDFDFLDVAKVVQLNQSQAGGNIPVGGKALAYYGHALFGRLAVKSHIGGQVPASPDLATGVTVSLSFHDQIALQNLNPLTGNKLRLDVALSGEMTGYSAINSGRGAAFQIGIENLDSTFGMVLALVQFSWYGETFSATNTSELSAPRFVPYPGEEPGFTQNPIPGPARHFFGARGYIDIPVDEEFVDDEGNPLLLFGEPFVLNVQLLASSSCGNEVPECLAITDFDAARIENARLVDENGDPVPGATFTSTSGYDYDTAPVPEPQAWVLMLAAIATLGSLRRRLPRLRQLRSGDAACRIE